MIELAGAVVVAGPGRQQSQLGGQRAQQSPGVLVVILVVNLHTVEGMVDGKCPQRGRGQHVLAVTPPRVTDDRHTPRSVHQLDAALQLDRVRLHMCRAPLGQVV